MNGEVWKDIEGYEGYYQVSNNGRVRSVERQVECNGKIHNRKSRILKPGESKTGYYRVVLSKFGKHKNASIHRLVAKAFLTTKKNRNCVNHKDLDKKNNRVKNLEWCSFKENSEHAVKNNRYKRGKDAARAELNDEKVIKIRNLYYSKENQSVRRLDMPYPITKLATMFGVSPQAIYCIIKRKTYKHV